MRFKCSNTNGWRTRRNRLMSWHQWWAWRPVCLKDSDECRWLETVERKGYPDDLTGFWDWDYRPACRGAESRNAQSIQTVTAENPPSVKA